MKLAHLSVADIRRELARREAGASRIQAQHAKLAKRMAKLDAELADLGVEAAPRGKPGRKTGRRGPGRPAGSRGGRTSKGGMTLLEAILKAVPPGKTVSPAEAAAAAKRAGYKTTSRTFGIQVAGTLAKAPGFKKLGRGQYERVGGADGGKAPKAAKGKPGRPKGSKNKVKAASDAAAA